MASLRSLLLLFALALASVLSVVAQSSSSNSSSSTSSSSLSQTTYLTTSFISTTIATQSGGSTVQVPTSVPTTLNVTSTITPTSTSASATSSASASATATPITLATVLDPAFGVLGGLLIITGLPSAFLGHKNRWSSFFLIGCYTLSLVCFVLILKFGILNAVNPPSKTLRGMFVLACSVAGIAGGGISIFFWKATRFFIGAWGGFAFALWIECFRDGGLIHTIGLRWILFIGCAVAGFVLCTIQKIHYHVVLVSTAFVGSSAMMLGVDCFTSANLKEFYIWNLGFSSLFPKYTNNGIQFPVSQTMEIELGLIGAIALMGVAVQLRILKLLQRKLKEIKEEQKRRDAENDSKEAERFSRLPQELAEWEKEHPIDGKHWRQNSEFSSVPLMQHNATDSPGTPGTPEPMFARNRNPSETSQLMLAPPYRAQSPGALPALDLGLDIQEDVPKGFMADVGDDTKESASNGSEAKKRKTELEAEISTLRRSIDLLGDSQASSASGSRHPSLTSRRTLSYDLNNAVLPAASHLRPPKVNEQRSRVQSMELSTLTSSQQAGNSIGRPTSAPLRNQDDWDAYVRDRKILQPPSGPSAPIATTPISMPMPAPAPRLTVPPAVHEALLRRGQREGILDGEGGVPLVSPVMDAEGAQFLGATSRHRHHRTNSSNVPHNNNNNGGSSAAVNVLPPRKGTSPNGGSPNGPHHPPRTVTYEELTERHREKLRELQAPLTQAEKEHAELEAAKARWERSKAVEKQAVMKRQAEQARLNEKKQQQQRTGAGAGAEDAQGHGDKGNAHSRSPSAGVGRPVTHTKRLSTMKVEDWQRYQSDVELQRSTQQQQKPSPSRRQSAVPFPDQPRGQQQRPNHERKGSRGLSGVLPPN
ncbi:uncharacterized protein STEHIDRAFT_144039 [Stereum hirsutum FP-91666 SS1]|uniref:uncharacterized protein n=1 Tax=Stereum hirsutum (strain FP-91666) TaxID=721885 RepID=UPI000440E783|nr:uncharacterized protein STEHIDRAFT_144039 [Stereum hirsutum FP-91666 SS1]EIM92735.1 hypothetical protein STEHIDRAFT_144039 [Stereum hirsutum FP-91666 SS1]